MTHKLRKAVSPYWKSERIRFSGEIGL